MNLDIRRQGKRWMVNGMDVAEVSGAEDIDLSFSPATNLLPIRRLALKVGDSATISAAWVRFPEFRLELLEQTYTRLDDAGRAFEEATVQIEDITGICLAARGTFQDQRNLAVSDSVFG